MAAAGSYPILISFEKVAMKIIKRDLSHLQVSDQDIIKYLMDARKQHLYDTIALKQQLFIRAFAYYGDSLPMLPMYDKYIQLKSGITGHFLMSTDVFFNKMDPSKPVTYLSFYDPLKRACSNPFPRLQG